MIHRSEGLSRAHNTDTSARPKLEEGVTMYIDYVRIYQEEGKESVTCDPREFLSVFFFVRYIILTATFQQDSRRRNTYKITRVLIWTQTLR